MSDAEQRAADVRAPNDRLRDANDFGVLKFTSGTTHAANVLPKDWHEKFVTIYATGPVHFAFSSPSRSRDGSIEAREALQTTEQFCRDLDALFGEKLGQDHPGLGGLASVLREQQRRMPAAPIAAPQAAAAQPATPPSAAQHPAASQASAPSVSAPSVSAASVSAAAPAAPRVSGSGDVLPALRSVGKSICPQRGARFAERLDRGHAIPFSLQA